MKRMMGVLGTVCLGLVFLAGLNLYPEDKMTGDCFPHIILPATLLGEGNFDFNEFQPPGQPIPYWYIRSTAQPDRIVSMYPPMTGVLFVPFYSTAKMLGFDLPAEARRVARFTATLYMALAGVLLVLAGMELGLSAGMAVVLGSLFVFGTGAWSTGAGGLWQHTPGMLCLAWFYWWFLLGLRRPGFLSAAGLPMSLAVAVRPTNAVFLIPALLYLLIYHRRRIPGFMVWALPAAIFVMVYNTWYFGNPLVTGYGQDQGGFTYPFLGGFLGLLVSPSRGIFVITPVWLFAFAALRGLKRDAAPALRMIAVSLLAVPLVILVFSRWYFWWGGLCYGYRIVSDISPVMTLAAGAILLNFRDRRGIVRTVFVLLAAVSVVFQAAAFTSIGYYPWHALYDRETPLDTARYDADPFPDLLWSVTNSQPAYHVKNSLKYALKRGLLTRCLAFRRPLTTEAFSGNRRVISGRDNRIDHVLKDYLQPMPVKRSWRGVVRPPENFKTIALRVVAEEQVRLQTDLRRYPISGWGQVILNTGPVEVPDHGIPIFVEMVDSRPPAHCRLEYQDNDEWRVVPDGWYREPVGP